MAGKLYKVSSFPTGCGFGLAFAVVLAVGYGRGIGEEAFYN